MVHQHGLCGSEKLQDERGSCKAMKANKKTTVWRKEYSLLAGDGLKNQSDAKVVELGLPSGAAEQNVN